MLVGAKLHIAAKLRKAGKGDVKALTDSALADAAESQALNVRMIAKANEAKAQLQLRRLQLESGEMIKKETAVAYMSNLFRMIVSVRWTVKAIQAEPGHDEGSKESPCPPPPIPATAA